MVSAGGGGVMPPGTAVVFDTCEDRGPILPALSTAATL